MTAFRIVDGDDITVRKSLHQMETISPIGKAILNQSQLILTHPALMYDSVYAFAIGLQNAIAGGHELKLAYVVIKAYIYF
jgi:ionotropic glutamate receptor